MSGDQLADWKRTPVARGGEEELVRFGFGRDEGGEAVLGGWLPAGLHLFSGLPHLW